jgi:hypothetical protein
MLRGMGERGYGLFKAKRVERDGSVFVFSLFHGHVVSSYHGRGSFRSL